MDLKTARIWQDVLLWGGAVVSLVGAWGGAWVADEPEPEEKKKIQHKKKKH